MPRAFILWPFFSTIKSAHSTLPYATGLKHTHTAHRKSPPLPRDSRSLRLALFPAPSISCSRRILLRSWRSAVSLRATCCTHIRTNCPPSPSFFYARMHSLTVRRIKARTRIVHGRDLRARTNVLPRRFTVNFGNRKSREREREKEKEKDSATSNV